MEQIIGIDFTDERFVDCSAVSCMCGHCRTIIATRTYSPDMNEVNVPFFIKCPHCGVKFGLLITLKKIGIFVGN